MRQLRFLAAGIALAVVTIAQTPLAAGAARADAGTVTNFTLVTPENAVVYATIQSTSTRQTRLLGQFGGALGTLATPALQTLLGQALGGSSGSGTSVTPANIQQITTLLGTALGHVFNGQLGLALLPITLTAGTGAVPVPQVHLLLDAGLQAGVNQSTLLFATEAFGLSPSSTSTYSGVPVISLDINALARKLGVTTAGTTLIPAGGPISSVFFGAVLGDDAVLATDMPALAAAIDAYRHTQPSIAASAAFTAAHALLPQDRFAELYVHFSAGNPLLLLQSLGAAVSLLPAAVDNEASGMDSALTAESNALLLSTSTPPSLQSTVLPLPGL